MLLSDADLWNGHNVGGERAYMVPDDTKEDKPLSLLLCTLKNLNVPQLQAAGFS